MKKFYALLLIGLMTFIVSGCAPSFTLEDGEYGYTLNLEDIADDIVTPIFIDATIIKSQFMGDSEILFTLDGSEPVIRDFTNVAVQLEMAQLIGTIPYTDTTDTGGPDFREFIKPGAAFMYASSELFPLGSTVEPSDFLSIEVKAIQYSPIVSPISPPEVITAKYTFDPTLWAGDYTITGNAADDTVDPPIPADIEAEIFGKIFISNPNIDLYFTGIEGTLTAVDLRDPEMQPAMVIPPTGWDGTLESVGGLTLKNNDYVGATSAKSTATIFGLARDFSIEAMEDYFDIIADHCGNGAIGPPLNPDGEDPFFPFFEGGDPDDDC